MDKAHWRSSIRGGKKGDAIILPLRVERKSRCALVQCPRRVPRRDINIKRQEKGGKRQKKELSAKKFCQRGGVQV